MELHSRAAIGQHRALGVRIPAKIKQLAEIVQAGASNRTTPEDLIAEGFDYVERDPQPFVDCNHRTAMLLGRYIARAFGLTLKYSGPQGRALRLRWEKMSRKELKAWVVAHLVPFEGD